MAGHRYKSCRWHPADISPAHTSAADHVAIWSDEQAEMTRSAHGCGPGNVRYWKICTQTHTKEVHIYQKILTKTKHMCDHNEMDINLSALLIHDIALALDATFTLISSTQNDRPSTFIQKFLHGQRLIVLHFYLTILRLYLSCETFYATFSACRHVCSASPHPSEKKEKNTMLCNAQYMHAFQQHPSPTQKKTFQ